MSDMAASLLTLALLVDAAANLLRIANVEIAYRKQAALIERQAEIAKQDREERERMAKEIVGETVKATLGELYEMSGAAK